MMPSTPARRKTSAMIRRDAGYAILEAMPPLITCGFLGTVIAAGLMIQAPVANSQPSSASPDQNAIQTESIGSSRSDESGGGPSPAIAEQRSVFVSRTYEERLAAAGQRTGTAFHGVPESDFTGNGNPDIMVTKPNATNILDGTDPTGGFGAVEVWTLWSASPVLTIDGVVQNDLFALSAKSAGDLDGDGADDIIVGAPLYHGTTGFEGTVDVYSGSDGQLLLSLTGNQWEYFGRTVAGVSDTDGDGQWDIAASSWVYDQDDEPYGMVSIHSGSDGALIRTYTSDLINDGFGYEIISMGDLDGDTYSEIAISAPLAPGDPLAWAQATGRLHVFHGGPRATQPEHLGTTDADLTILNPDPLIDHFAVAVELTTDQDSDGVADLLVISLIDPGTPAETTAIQVYSSVTGGLLWPVSIPPPGSGSGRDAGDGHRSENYPNIDENGNLIHYSHYTSGLGVFGDTTRDLRVEQADLDLVLTHFGNPAAPGNPVSGDLTLSGQVDITDLNVVITGINESSIVLDFIDDPNRLLTRWSSLDPYQYGDYVTGDPGRVSPPSDRGGNRSTDPVFPYPRPMFPGFDSQTPCKAFLGCGGCYFYLCCAPGSSCGDHFGDGKVEPDPDTNNNGIPDSEDCSMGGTPPSPSGCTTDPCVDSNGNGIIDQYDCDSPCYDERYNDCDCIRADNFEGAPGAPYIACLDEEIALEFTGCPEECSDGCIPMSISWEIDGAEFVSGGQSGDFFAIVTAAEPQVIDISADNGCCTLRWHIAWVDLSLESVEFGGDNHTVHSDKDGSELLPIWKAAIPEDDEDEVRNPIAYTITRDGGGPNLISIEQVRIRAALPDDLAVEDFKLTATGSIGQNSFDSGPVAVQKDGAYLTASNFNLTECPSVVGWEENFSVAWNLTYQDNPIPCVGTMTSINNVYFTQNDPMRWPHYAEQIIGVPVSPALYHTVLEVACRGANGLNQESSDDEITQQIYTYLQSLSIKRASDDILLKFWHEWETDVIPPQYLRGGLAALDGNTQCNFWTELLFAALHAHGYDHNNNANYISVVYPGWSLNPAIGLDNTRILIAQWTFDANGSAPPTVMPFTHTQGEVAVGQTIPAQGNPNPPPRFINHYVLRYNDMMYDPSFQGAPATAAVIPYLKEFEKRFAGYRLTTNGINYYKQESHQDPELFPVVKYPE